MGEKLSRFGQKPPFIITLSFVAVLLYNDWLLGPFLNNELYRRGGSVSEYSALTQPHFWIFRGLDMAAGALLVLLAVVLSKRMPGRSRSHTILIWGTIVLGLANILDAAFVLPCSETLSSACSVPVNISFSHYRMPSHGYSSMLIAVTYLLLPFTGLLYAAARKLNVFMLFSAVATAFALESLLSAIMQYFSHNSFSVRASGAGQKIQMLVLAAWFICWSWSVCIPKQPVAKHTGPIRARSFP